MNTCSVANCSKEPAVKGMCLLHYGRARREMFRDPEMPRRMRHTDGEPQRDGLRAQESVAALLRSACRRVERMPYNSDYDLFIDSKWKCEVKSAKPISTRPMNGPSWFFNVHRHGVVKENCHFYVLRLEDVPGHKYAVHLLVRAPVGTKTVCFTLRSLIETAAPMVQEFDNLKKGRFVL